MKPSSGSTLLPSSIIQHRSVPSSSSYSRAGQDSDEDSDRGSDSSGQDSADEEKVHRSICNATVLDDLFTAVYEVRVSAPFVALLSLLLGYYLTIAPYRTDSALTTYFPNGMDVRDMDLNTVRPVLTKDKMQYIHKTLLYTGRRLPRSSSVGHAV